jgi:GrpB-like predicted nucleotidyltransferase (UPF0157 family)
MDRGGWEVGLDAALIGGREKAKIVIADYDARWPTVFEGERDRIRHALGDLALRIEHIGSTAVPGLAAKPIIDVLVAVEDPDDGAILRAMESAGYALRVREPGHRMFRTSARDVHVHVWGAEDPEIELYLAFREQLRRSVDDRRAYELLKRDLAAREWADMNEYAYAKGELIGTILARAGINSE